MVPRIYSQNNALKLSTVLVFLFASITSFGQNPVFTTPAMCPGTSTVTLPVGGGAIIFTNANIEGFLSVNANDPGGGTVTYSTDVASVDCSNEGNIVTIIVTATNDTSPGESASCTIGATIVNGGGLPDAECMNITVNLSGGGVVTPSDIDDGSFSCSGITNMTVNEGMGSVPSVTYDCSDVGTQMLNLEITDANGTSTCTATITVVDDIVPTFSCPTNQTIALNSSCQIVIPDLITGIVDEADNCGAVTMTQSPAAAMTVASSEGGTTSVTITATDINGNTTTCDVTLTGDDTTAPTATCLATLTVNLDASGNYALTAAELDANSSDNCGTTNLSIPATTFDCSDIATSPHVITLTVDDGNGNMSTCITSVTVQDLTPPPFLSDLTAINNFNNCEATVSFPSTAPDNCGTFPVIINSVIHEKGSPVIVFNSGGNYFGDFPIGITTVDYTITDDYGNTITSDFEITIFDDEAPNIICPSTQTLDFAICNSASASLPDYRSLLGVSDNCPVNQFVNIEQNPTPGTLLSTISTPADSEVIVVTFNVTDVSPSVGNTGTTCTFSVVLNEENTPTPNELGAILAPIDGECGPLTIPAPTAIDECGNIICGEPFPPVATLIAPCTFGNGVIGNLSETIDESPNLSIPDNTPSGATSTGTVSAPAFATITDVNLTIEIDHSSIGDLQATLTSPNGTTVVLFDRPGVPVSPFGCAGNDLDVTFDDEAVNTATVFENLCGMVSPAISGSFQSSVPLSLFDGETPSGDWNLNVIDNSNNDIGTIVSWTIDIEYDSPSGDFAEYEFPAGTHNITWNYDDGFGNTATQQQVITVTDDIVGPIISCQNIGILLDASGSASIISNDILNGTATDNCSDPTDISISINQASFNCNHVGTNLVTLTATDEAGNITQCISTVTVFDATSPVLNNIPVDVTVDCDAVPTAPTIGLGIGEINASDACGTLDVIFNEISFQSPNTSLCEHYNYEIIRAWSVSDVNGNNTDLFQFITVQDQDEPIFVPAEFPSSVTVNSNAGSCDAFVTLELTSDGVSDLPNCADFTDLTITNNGNGTGDADASGTYPVGSTQVTYTVTDPCGNSDSYIVNVNVIDNTPPIAACNAITVGIPDGQDSIIIDASIISLIDNGSFDNCSPTVDLDVSPSVFYCSQIADGTQSTFAITLSVSVPGSTDTTFCETTIIIQDNNDPVVTCADPLIITLEADGTATATTAMLNDGIDDCSDIMTIELIGNTSFGISDIGSHPVSDGITPTLQATDVHGNVGTCTPTTLIVTPPTTCFISNDVTANGEVEIPYTSTDFTNVIGFQFSIQVDDETVATFAQDDAANLCGAVTINVPNLSGVNQNLICNGTFTNQISVDGKVLSVSWFNTSTDPISIPNGETLFNFRLDALGVVGDMTSFSITGNPYANELSTKYGNDILVDTPPLCIDSIGIFEVGDNATLPVSGNISTWSRTRIDTISIDTNFLAMPNTYTYNLDTVTLVAGQGLENASLINVQELLPLISNSPDTTDTDMTDFNGNYSVQVANVPGGVALELYPRKDNPNWLNNGDVNSSDLFFIQQHIVNNIPFSSIYDYVAADVNQSGTITTLDLVLIQDVIVNPEISPIPSSVIDAYNPWRFIQKEYAEISLDPYDLDPSIALPSQPMAPVVPAADQNRMYNPASLPMTDIDWIAVKVGQIFGGLNTNTLTTNDVDSRTGENLVMSAENQKVINGQLISIPVYARDYAAFIAWQFTLEFDENYLSFEDIVPGAMEGFNRNKLGLNAVEEGIIGALWYGNPKSVSSNEVLFTLQFTALDNADALSGLIDITSRTVKSQSSLISGATGEVSLAFFSPTATLPTNFELHQNRPNPFNGETLISFNLPEAGFATMTISDISGRALKVVEGDFAKGYNEVRIQSNDLSSTGVLYYQLRSAEHFATKKMIILN